MRDTIRCGMALACCSVQIQYCWRVVISLKNGGGIRDSIGASSWTDGSALRVPPPANPRVGKNEGDISQLDIENALRFNNGLGLMALTAQQLRDTMEWCGQERQLTDTRSGAPQRSYRVVLLN